MFCNFKLQKTVFSKTTYITLPFIPSPQGRGIIITGSHKVRGLQKNVSLLSKLGIIITLSPGGRGRG